MPATKAASADRVADLDLASRLSFFLWGTPPDKELLDVAASGKLSQRRCSRSRRGGCSPTRAPRRSASASPAQWLRLQDLDKVRPDSELLPELRRERRRRDAEETETFFNYLVHDDRSLLELFIGRLHLRERAPGAALRLPERRRRPLPQGAVPRRHPHAASSARARCWCSTSLANRTSPVLRGKWVMEVLLGTPPPPPPPNVPALEETGDAKDGKMLTTRERMEMHRANATCNACHRFMDPIGLALDNFDVTGRCACVRTACRSTPAATSSTARRSTT